MNYRLLIAVVSLIIAISIFLIINDFYPTGAAITNKNLQTIKVGYIPSASATPMFIGINRGYFEDENIKLELVPFESGRYTEETLTRGDVDIVVSVPLEASTFNAFERGVPIYIVGGLGQALPWLSIRKDLWDSGEIREIKDLKGKRVQVSSEGSGNYFGLAYVLKQEGLDIRKDVDLVYLEQAETLAALESKSIDAASLRPPYLTFARTRDLGVLYPNMSKYFKSDKGFQRGVILASSKFMNENSDVLKAFMRAHVKAGKIFEYAYEGIEPYRTEAVKIISNLTGIEEEIVREMEWYYIPKDGKPDIELVKDMHDYYVETGVLENPIDLNKFINLSFLPD
jgi:NitT/TauT family transport system substrate-binding protein